MIVDTSANFGAHLTENYNRSKSSNYEKFQNLNAVEWWRFAIKSVIKDNRSKNG